MALQPVRGPQFDNSGELLGAQITARAGESYAASIQGGLMQASASLTQAFARRDREQQMRLDRDLRKGMQESSQRQRTYELGQHSGIERLKLNQRERETWLPKLEEGAALDPELYQEANGVLEGLDRSDKVIRANMGRAAAQQKVVCTPGGG